MGFLKRYPVFCGLIFLFLLVFGAGVFLVLQQTSELREQESDYEAGVRQVEQVSRGVFYDDESDILVPPTAENRRLLEERLEQVRADLRLIRDEMVARTESILSDDADEFTFLPKLQAFIARMKSDAAAGEIGLNTDEAFGFARYAIDAEQPAAEFIPVLDQQRQVIAYIIRQLMASGPTAILSVERELVERTAEEEEGRPGRPRRDDDVFVIEDLVTARANEFIDTFAFRLVFTGRTHVLREFLNRLASFELPLVVRSIEVAPAEQDDRPEIEEEEESQETDALASLFGEEPEEEVEDEEVDDSRKPVITENESKFTIVIEFVEVRIEDGGDAMETEEEE